MRSSFCARMWHTGFAACGKQRSRTSLLEVQHPHLMCCCLAQTLGVHMLRRRHQVLEGECPCCRLHRESSAYVLQQIACLLQCTDHVFIQGSVLARCDNVAAVLLQVERILEVREWDAFAKMMDVLKHCLAQVRTHHLLTLEIARLAQMSTVGNEWLQHNFELCLALHHGTVQAGILQA